MKPEWDPILDLFRAQGCSVILLNNCCAKVTFILLSPGEAQELYHKLYPSPETYQASNPNPEHETVLES